MLIEWLASNAFDGARVVLVSTAESPLSVNYPADEWLTSRGWTGEVLVIDAIDIDFMVLEGGGDHVAALKQGPILTFDRETGIPTIVGHRTTFGAPFLRLDELQIGDRFTFTTIDGTRTFEVTLIDRCDSDAPCPARDEDDLLLAAYDPEYTGDTRLTVHATEVVD